MLVRANHERDGQMFSGMGVYEGVGSESNSSTVVTKDGSRISSQVIKSIDASILQDESVRDTNDSARFRTSDPKTTIWIASAAAAVFLGLSVYLMRNPKSSAASATPNKRKSRKKSGRKGGAMPSRMPCSCGSKDAYWHGDEYGLREYSCDACARRRSR